MRVSRACQHLDFVPARGLLSWGCGCGCERVRVRMSQTYYDAFRARLWVSSHRYDFHNYSNDPQLTGYMVWCGCHEILIQHCITVLFLSNFSLYPIQPSFWWLSNSNHSFQLIRIQDSVRHYDSARNHQCCYPEPFISTSNWRWAYIQRHIFCCHSNKACEFIASTVHRIPTHQRNRTRSLFRKDRRSIDTGSLCCIRMISRESPWSWSSASPSVRRWSRLFISATTMNTNTQKSRADEKNNNRRLKTRRKWKKEMMSVIYFSRLGKHRQRSSRATNISKTFERDKRTEEQKGKAIEMT